MVGSNNPRPSRKEFQSLLDKTLHKKQILSGKFEAGPRKKPNRLHRWAFFVAGIGLFVTIVPHGPFGRGFTSKSLFSLRSNLDFFIPRLLRKRVPDVPGNKNLQLMHRNRSIAANKKSVSLNISQYW